MSSRKKIKQYLAMWDIYGLECIFDVSEEIEKKEIYEKQKIVKILKDEPIKNYTGGIPLKLMILRAKFNNQRQYEIYEFTSTLSLNTIRKQFIKEPQLIVDWIRLNGHKIYSDKTKEKQLVY